MGLFRQSKIKDGVAGHATVIAMSDPRPNDRSDGHVNFDFSARIHVRFQLRVALAGQPQYDVQHGCQVKPKKMPVVGSVLPVTVSRDDPQQLRIEWDDAPDSVQNPNGLRFNSPVVVEQSSTVQIDVGPTEQLPPAIAEMLKAQGIDIAAMTGGAEIQMGQPMSADAAETYRQNMLGMLQGLGIDAGSAAGPVPGSSPAGDAGDDTLEALERLVALRDQGVLTEAEFAAQKARILGGG